jgi:ribosomal protein L44E
MSGNRRLTASEQELARSVLQAARGQLKEAARDDPTLLWALRRFVYLRLQYDERGKPMQRKILKLTKMASQKGLCAVCREELPERGAELDRFNAMDGYTEANTRLVCHECHRKSQAEKGFA